MLTNATSSQHQRDNAAQRDARHDAERWLLLRTRSRHERIVARAAAAAGFVTVFPMTKCSRAYGDRTLCVDVPLLPGAVFVRATVQSVAELRERGWLTEVVEIADQEQAEHELKQLGNAAMVAGLDISAVEYCADATRVEVRTGPLQGLRGVISRQRRDVLLLPVHAVGRALSVEVDPASLQVVS